MIDEIVFLTRESIDKRIREKFGIETLRADGFDVRTIQIILDDLEPALSEIRRLSSNTFVMNFVDYSLKTCPLYRGITASGAYYAVLVANSLPSAVPRSKMLADNLRKLGPKTTLRKLMNYWFFYISPRWVGIRPADLILAGGEKSLQFNRRYPTGTNSEILWVHATDYDIYLKEKKVPSVERSIAVFLDEYLPFHPDIKILDVPFSIDSDRYYQLLNKFFDAVERKLGLKVVIAAHPRSRYDGNYFAGRECVKGETARLVKNSRLVLAHGSDALNFANLFRKPVIFLSSRELDKSYFGPVIRTMANWFGKKPVFIDENEIDWDRELKISIDHYEKYRRAYIKTNHSEELPFWQIVANRLKNW
jgi:hypothetical protein